MRFLLIKFFSRLLKVVLKNDWLYALLQDAKKEHFLYTNKTNNNKSYELVAKLEDFSKTSEDNVNVQIFSNSSLIAGVRVVFRDNYAQHFDFKTFEHGMYISDDERNNVFRIIDEDIYKKNTGKFNHLQIEFNFNEEIQYDKIVPLFSVNNKNFFHFCIDYLSVLSQLGAFDPSKIKILYEKDIPSKYSTLMFRIFPNYLFEGVERKNLILSNRIILPKRAIEHRHWLRGGGVEAKSYVYKDTLKLLNKNIINAFTASNKSGPKVILLERNSNFRITLNENTLKEELKIRLETNFRSVDPTEVTHNEMFNFLSNARIVLCQTGASIANAVFSKKPQIWILWMFRNERQDEKMFVNFLEGLGHSVIVLNATAVKRQITMDQDLTNPSQYDLIVNEEKVWGHIIQALSKSVSTNDIKVGGI